MANKIVWNGIDGSEALAFESPLEEGVYHYPEGSVDVKPPDFNPNTQNCFWNGSDWSVSDIPAEPVFEAPPTPEYPEPQKAPPVEPTPEEKPYVPTYADKRLIEYGVAEEQIAFITEHGLEAWQAKVAEIKKKYPKE